MSPPSVETNRYWNTPGDFNLGPSMQGLVGHDPETGIYDDSGLAESWTHNDEFTEWTFTLHEAQSSISDMVTLPLRMWCIAMRCIRAKTAL